MSEMIQSEGTQGFTLTQKKVETPNLNVEDPLPAAPQQENQEVPEKHVREGSEGGQQEERWDDGEVDRLNSLNNNGDDERFDMPPSLPDSIHERGTEAKSHQPTDTPRYESQDGDLDDDVRAIQSMHENRLGVSRDLNPEGGSLSESSFEQARPLRIEGRSKSVGYIEGGSSESSNNKSPNKQDSIEKHPSIVLQQLNTFKEGSSSISRS